MSNFKALNADNEAKFLAETGAGTDLEPHVPAVGFKGVPIDVVPTLTVHATYVSGDFVGTDHTSMEFAAAARATGLTGTITSAVLIDKGVLAQPGELWLFDTAPAGLGHDSDAFTITDADAARCIGVIPFATYYASALNSVSNGLLPNGGLDFKAAATSIFGCYVTRGAPAYADGDLLFRLFVRQD